MKLFERGINCWKLKYCCEYCGYHSKYLWGKYNNEDKFYCLYFNPKREIKRDFKERVWESGYGSPSSDEIFPKWCPLEVINGKNT